ncbi:hypothetical protein L1987_02017 [Smallanthus sonchifolius]|uniref:Uncharacterized protein n=1 Tax=Smallanthus sonchifolius TaxID=185202 RepID=A0ACB9K6N9_9ASTR|nr:hypothetical protein L1987_02017 [Smallanthus sonchifolius]
MWNSSTTRGSNVAFGSTISDKHEYGGLGGVRSKNIAGLAMIDDKRMRAPSPPLVTSRDGDEFKVGDLKEIKNKFDVHDQNLEKLTETIAGASTDVE